MAKVIDQMFAFVVIDTDGDEGIPAFSHGGMVWPLVGGDVDRIESLMERAREIAKASGKPMKIYRYSVREQIGEVNP